MTRRQKVLFVNPSGGAFGSEQSLLRLIEATSLACEVVCPLGGELDFKLKRKGITVHGLGFGEFSLKENPAWHARFLIRFLKIVVQSKPDAIVINLDGNSSSVSIVAKLLRIPIIRFCRFEFDQLRLTKREEMSWKMADVIICPSDAVKLQVQTWSQSVGKDILVHRIFDTIDLKHTKQDGDREDDGLEVPKVEYLLGYVGRIHRGKRLEIAIEALAAIRGRGYNLGLWIIGEGDGSDDAEDYKRWLLSLSEERRVSEHVYFYGFLDYDLVPSAMSNIDVLLLPSQSESFGMVLIEAWAVGTPSVSSNVGGPAEITRLSHAGMLADLHDTDQFIECVSTLLLDTEAAKKCSSAGISWVEENCAPETAARSLEGIVEDLCSR